MISLAGKVAVVIGGSSGIGEATVRLMASLGARVVIGDVDEAGAKAITADVETGAVEFLQTDIFDEQQIVALMNLAVSRYGQLDILVNSAGVPRSIAPDAEILDLPVEWWNKTIAGHLTSTMLACKYALPKMITSGGGSIVNISSAACSWATVDLPSYSAAKAGVNQLSREVAATYGRDNIRCNVVVPGAVLTPRGRATMTPAMFDLFASETPLTRLTQAIDVANVVVFLASDSAAMVTGQSLNVDGGMMTKLPYWLPKMRARLGERFAETTAQYESSE